VPVDLDQRLRHALGGPGPAVDGDAALGSVQARLPRYRARRRAVRLTAASAAVAVTGLGTGLALGLERGPSAPVTTSAAPPTPVGCVAVKVGDRPAACMAELGAVAVNAPAAGRQMAAAASGPPPVPQTLRAVAGSPVSVLLPHLPGRSWVTVSFWRLGSAPATRALPRRVAGGGSLEVVAHAGPGAYELRVSAVSGSSGTAGAGVSQWSVDVSVAPR